MTRMSAAKNSLATREPTPEYGPCMRVLHLRWQRAVLMLFVAKGNQTKAIELAGYEGKPDVLKVTASRIYNQDSVRAAIAEQMRSRIDISEPEVFEIVASIMRDPKEKAADRLRASAMIWDRSNPVMTKHEIVVSHQMTDEERDIRHWLALKKIGAPQDAFLARFGPNGIARVEALVLAEEAKRRELEAGTINVDYEEIIPDTMPAPAVVATEQQTFDEDLL